MLFTELRFLAFFAIVFPVAWLLRRNSWRKGWLLLASYLFYAGWDWRFLGLILISTAVDFVVGLQLGRSSNEGRRRVWLLLSLVVNLGLLGVFKYFNFFLESAVSFLDFLGLPTSVNTLQIILPVGISFYTFQTLSYSIDVYRRRLQPTRNLVDFALFVAFFPQLVAGPIVRASHFLPQLVKARRWIDVPLRSHLTLFLIGYIKKACIADNIAARIDPLFADPLAAAPFVLWLGIVLYAVQIYCDFSGYSDMAIAIAGLLGYQLPLNFNHPYIAGSITDFWRRWHISLSSWFRDYLYIPLGGNRGTTRRVLLNLVIVFFLCGLWHGAEWKFVVWGMIHGLFLSLERLTLGSQRSSWRPWGFVYAQLVAVLAWIPFRAPDLAGAWLYFRGLLAFGSERQLSLDLAPGWWALLAALFALHALFNRKEIDYRLARLPDSVFAAAYGLAVAFTLPWVAVDYQPFIYFQF